MISDDDLKLGEKIANSLEKNFNFSENSNSEIELASKIANYANNTKITEYSYSELDTTKKIGQAIEEAKSLSGEDFWKRTTEIKKAIKNLESKNSASNFSEKASKNPLIKMKKILEAIREGKDADYIIKLQNELTDVI